MPCPHVQGGPSLTAEGRQGWDPILLDCRPSAPEAGVAGKARGTGAGTGAGEHGSLSDGAVAASHLLPALGAPGFWRTGRCAEAGSRVPSPTLSSPASAAPTPAQASVTRRALSPRGPTKLPLCPAARAGPNDVSLRAQPGGASMGCGALWWPKVEACASEPRPVGAAFTKLRPEAQPAAQRSGSVEESREFGPPHRPLAMSATGSFCNNARALPTAFRKHPHSLSPSPNVAEALQPPKLPQWRLAPCHIRLGGGPLGRRPLLSPTLFSALGNTLDRQTGGCAEGCGPPGRVTTAMLSVGLGAPSTSFHTGLLGHPSCSQCG